MPSTAESPPAATVRVGRQPIFDAEREVIGYELLYRGSDTATTCTADSQTATAVVVTNTMLEFGLETLTGGALAFFNCDAGTWRQELFELLPKDQVVLEVLEDDVVSEIEPFVRSAKEKGYRIALDDVVSASDRAQLLPLADIIKLELPALSNEQIREITRSNHSAGRKVLAEKVETQEEFDHAKRAGCDYFFAKPSTVRSAGQLPQSQLQTLQLLTELTDERTDPGAVADKVACDVALSVRLLRYANSAAVGCRGKAIVDPPGGLDGRIRYTAKMGTGARAVGSFERQAVRAHDDRSDPGPAVRAHRVAGTRIAPQRLHRRPAFSPRRDARSPAGGVLRRSHVVR